MRAVDVDALARYRDALARQVHQADAHGHSSHSEPRTHPAVSPARQRLSSSHTRSRLNDEGPTPPARSLSLARARSVHLWRAPVHHAPDVGLVDPHAERDGRDDDGRGAREELAVAPVHTTVT